MADKPVNIDKGVSRWLWWVPALLIVIGLATMITGVAKTKSYPIAAEAQEFHLKVGEEIPTVEAGPGTRHRIWGNKPYKMRRVLPDGNEKIYPMPAGWETLTGVEPVGRVRLIGEEPNTVIKIIQQQ